MKAYGFNKSVRLVKVPIHAFSARRNMADWELECLNHELMQLTCSSKKDLERGEQAVVERATAEFTQRALTEPRVTLQKACEK
ncbi:hypothetical protein Tco_1457887 [Tanacetum coccineum]